MSRGGRVVVGTWAALGFAGLVCSARADDGMKKAGLPAEYQAKFDELDRDRDGRLRPEEWPLGKETFAKADANQDGGLTIREVIRWKVRDEAKKGKLGDDLRKKFREADKDGDGWIARAEFAYPDQLFERFDRDGDGKVSFVEALAFVTEEELGKAFATHDKDLSGTLSLAELPLQHREAFVAADANDDGELTGEEARSFFLEVQKEAAGQVAAAAPSTKPASAAKAPASGVVSATSILLEQLAAADKDGDGKLSRTEFPCSRELFQRCDVDRDGAVDRAELALRVRRSDEAVARAQRLKARGQALSLPQDGPPALVTEALGLLAASRVEEVEALLDELELILDRLEAGR